MESHSDETREKLKEALSEIHLRVPVHFNGKIEPQEVYLRGTGIDKVIEVIKQLGYVPTSSMRVLTDEQLTDILIANDTVIAKTVRNRELWLGKLKANGHLIRAIALAQLKQDQGQ